MASLTERDEFRHVLRDHPHSRESLFYGVPLPEHELLVFHYTWVGAASAAGHLFGVIGADGERLVFNAGEGEDVGDRDFDDWRAGGLTVRHTEPLRVAEIGFEGDGCVFEATFTGMHEPFAYGHDSIDGCPAFIADERFEQSCRVTGTLSYDGNVIEIDGTGQRDHSWGTRDWDTIQDWKYIHVHNADGDAVHIMLLHARGDTTRHGYVLRDGERHQVVDARVATTFDDHFRQAAAELTLTDATGAVTKATVERKAIFAFEAGERMVLHEAACAGTIEGRPAAAHYEMGWEKAYVALQAARATAA